MENAAKQLFCRMGFVSDRALKALNLRPTSSLFVLRNLLTESNTDVYSTGRLVRNVSVCQLRWRMDWKAMREEKRVI